MNKWIKFPLLFGAMGTILGIFFHPIKILNVHLISLQGTRGTIYNFILAGTIDGFIIGIIMGLIIALIVKRR